MVGEVQGNPVVLCNLDHLLHRFVVDLRHASGVRDQGSTVFRQHRGELGDLFGSRETSRAVEESDGKADRPRLERFLEHLFHRRHLVGGGSPFLHSHQVHPEDVVTGQDGHVVSQTVSVHVIEILGHAGPLEGQSVPREREVPVRPDRVMGLRTDGRRAEATVPGNDGRHSLPHPSFHHLGMPRGGEKEVEVGVHIDEPGRHGQTLGIDHLSGLRIRKSPHILDAVLADDQIRPHGRSPGAVHDRSVLDQDVLVHLEALSQWISSFGQELSMPQPPAPSILSNFPSLFAFLG